MLRLMGWLLLSCIVVGAAMLYGYNLAIDTMQKRILFLPTITVKCL